jgi:hypothetical protein
VALATALAVLVALPAVAGATDDDGPSERLEAWTETPLGGPGDEIIVRGRGWPASTGIQVQLCGNLARSGTADCDPRSTATTSTGSEGTFGTRMVVTMPPTPCPCTIFVRNQEDSRNVRIPFEVVGAPVGTVARDTGFDGELEVREVRLDGGGPELAWLGAPPERRLHLEVYNGTSRDIQLQGTFLWGRGDDVTNVLSVGELPTIIPGETAVIEHPVRLDVLAFGSYTVRGEIGSFAEKVEFEATTSSHPWVLLLVVPALVVQWVLIRVRDRVRRRVLAAGEPAPDGPTSTEEPVEGEVPVGSERDERELVGAAVASSGKGSATARPSGPGAGPPSEDPASRAEAQRGSDTAPAVEPSPVAPPPEGRTRRGPAHLVRRRLRGSEKRKPR